MENLKKYIAEAEKRYKCSINDKRYDVTIIRGLVIYFTYRAGNRKRSKKKITFQAIANYLGIDRTTALKAYHRTENIVLNFNSYSFSNEKQKMVFQTFYYLFKKMR